MEVTILDHGYVREVTHWGSDEDIIASARMSTSGAFNGWGPVHATPEVCRLHPEYCDCPPKEGDEKLLRYLWEHHHTSPFEMAGLTIEVQAPILVFREWHRHRTQSYSELSARYTELPDLYYIPSIERLMAGKQSTKGKQGSAAGFTVGDATLFQNEMRIITGVIREMYESLLKNGMARELARTIIPMSQYSRMRASANLKNWLDFLTLRTAEGAQFEIREYAKAVGSLVEARFPRTYGLWKEGQSE